MLDSSGNIGAARPCPYLGLENDPSTSCMFVSDFHRCFRRTMPEVVAEEQQAGHCISGRYAECPRFTTVEPDTASKARERGGQIRPAWSRRGRLLAAAAVICALAVVAFVISSASRGANLAIGIGTSSTSPLGQLPADAGSPATSLTPAVAGTTPAIPQTPRAQSIPVPGSSSGRPTGTPTGSQKSYLVAPGDTLWGIAQKHGISIESLMQANGLTDRTYVRSGQRLVIPER